MPNVLLQPLQPWRDFYLLVGGAAATLVGLVFVAITLGSRLLTPSSVPAMRVFVTPTIIHFVYVLLIATVAVLPDIGRMPLGAVLVATGVLSIVHALKAIPPYLRTRAGRPDPAEREDWLWYVAAPCINHALLTATGIALLLGVTRALDGLALTAILPLVNGIRNAWNMVVWFAVRTEPPA